MKVSVIGLAVACLLIAGSAFASQELAKSNNCTACHKTEKGAKGLGPSFADIADKYKDDAEAAATLEKAITEGSKGKWGGAPMPAQPNVKAEDAKAMAEWIVSMKSEKAAEKAEEKAEKAEEKAAE